MSEASGGGLIDEYRQTWHSTGRVGQRFLLGGFIYAVRIIAFTVAFPLFAKERGFDSSQVGLFVAIGSFSLFLFGIPVTRYGGRGYSRLILMIAPLFSMVGIAVIVLAPAGSFWLVFLGALLSGSVSTAFWILGDPILAAAVPARQRAHVYALKFSLITFGFALGGGLGGWIPALFESAGIERETALALTMAFLGILDLCQSLAYRTMPVTVDSLTRTARSMTDRLPSPRLNRKMLWIFTLLVMPEIGMAIGHNAIRPFLSLFFDEEFGLSTGVTGTAIAVMMLVGGVGALLLPRLAWKFGNVTTIGVIRILGAVAVAIVVSAINLAVVMMAMLVYFAIVDGTEALFVTEAMDRLPTETRTSFSGFYAMGWSAASAFAAAASGLLQDRSGEKFVAAFGLGIAGYALSGLWCLLVYPRIPPLTSAIQNDVLAPSLDPT